MGNCDLVKALLDAGAGASGTKNKQGCRPLMQACTEGHADTVRLVMMAGVDTLADATESGWTPLITAVHDGNVGG